MRYRHPCSGRGPHVRGFTLIELLIVIVILGLLLSLVAPAMFSKVSSSQRKTAMAQMQMLATALDTYRLDLGGYPVVVSGGAVYVTSGASAMGRPGNALLVYAVEGEEAAVQAGGNGRPLKLDAAALAVLG